MSKRAKFLQALDRDARIIELGMREASRLGAPPDMRPYFAEGAPPIALDHKLAAEGLVEVVEVTWKCRTWVAGVSAIAFRKESRARLTEVGKVVYLKILAETASRPLSQ